MAAPDGNNSITDNLREIGRDLMIMEISTIASDGITGRKMPWFPHAVIDILDKYRDWFEVTIGVDFDKVLAESAPLDKAFFVKKNRYEPGKSGVTSATTNGWRTVEQLRRAAKYLLDDELMEAFREKPLDDTQKGIALRIRRNCDQLKPIIVRFRGTTEWRHYFLEAGVVKLGNFEFEAGKDTADDVKWKHFRPVDRGISRTDISIVLNNPDRSTDQNGVINPDVVGRIRKIWEMGTDEIIAQTVVQIDGDVVTRFKKGLPDEEQAFFVSMHHRGVETALQQWNTLFNAFQKLIGGLADLIFGRKPGA
jgi:hypothetical protein